MTKFDTNGLTEWLHETEAKLESLARCDAQWCKAVVEVLNSQKRRLKGYLESADSSGPTDGPASEARVTCTAVHQLAEECAAAICDRWAVGFTTGFCDEQDWEYAEAYEVANLLTPFLERAMRLSVKSG